MLVAILLTLVVLCFKEPLLYLFGASEQTITYASEYIAIYAIGTIFVQLTLGMNAFISAQGFSTISMLTVIIGAVTNSNGVIYATLAGEYGEESDVGATSILALNDGPFFTMIALGAAGMGTFPAKDMIACMVPMILGFIVGNLDHEWRKILAHGMVLLPPFNGFTLGVQAVNPNATVYVKELGTWTDEVNEYAFAEELIKSYGCGVIAQHCDSAQPQLAAEKAGQFGCGYNSDMTADAPAAHLTAPVWNWDVYYKLAIQTAMDCESADQFVEKMGGPAYYGGLNEGMVDVSPLSDNCAAGTQDAIDQVKALIASGEWDVFSGVKLNITVTDGKASIEKVDAPLVTSDRDEVKDDQVVVPANTEIVPAGGPSVEDSVITGSMNYLVKGVVVA